MISQSIGRWIAIVTLAIVQISLDLPANGQDKAAEETTEQVWDGLLEGPNLRLEIHLVPSDQDDGSFTGKLISLDQGNATVPVSSASISEGMMKLTLPLAGASFEGKLNEAMTECEGKWKQGPASLPLTLKKRAAGEEAPAVERKTWDDRPQKPKEPIPYKSREVTFVNDKDSVQLAGTLTIPEGNGPFPAVVLVSGSGPQDRDETLMAHKPFVVIADYLSRNGIAVLRYDDRGVGQSNGDFNLATTQEFANDASAAIDFLSKADEINPSHLGIIGHSEGGLIAPIVANANDNVAFIILLAGPAIDGIEIIKSQSKAIALAGGAAEADLKSSQELNDRLFETLRDLQPDDVPAEKLGMAFDQWIETVPEEERETAKAGKPAIFRLGTPWFRFFATYDPVPALQALKVPSLALFGENDLQVLPNVNAQPMRQALESNGVSGNEVVVFPKLNHLFQESTTGSPTEYGAIEETMNPMALKKMLAWIQARVD